MVLSFLQCRCIRSESVRACMCVYVCIAGRCSYIHASCTTTWRHRLLLFAMGSYNLLYQLPCLMKSDSRKRISSLQRRKYHPRSDSKGRLFHDLQIALLISIFPMLFTINCRRYKFGFMKSETGVSLTYLQHDYRR